MRADDVNGVLGPQQAFAEIDVRIGEVYGENEIVIVHNRAERQQPQPVEIERAPRCRKGFGSRPGAARASVGISPEPVDHSSVRQRRRQRGRQRID